MKQENIIRICTLEVVVMPNDEVICKGKSLGQRDFFGKYLKVKDPKNVSDNQITIDQAIKNKKTNYEK
jgi:hypothetical protein